MDVEVIHHEVPLGHQRLRGHRALDVIHEVIFVARVSITTQFIRDWVGG